MFQSYWNSLREIIVRKGWSVCALIVLFMPAFQLHAIEFTELQVYEDSGVYYIRVVAEIDAPVQYVHKVLTDYEHIYRLNPSVTESQLLPSPGNGVVRVKTRILDCVLIFCMEIDRVEDVYELPAYDLRTVIVPTLSSFRSGEAGWQIEGRNERSQIVYEAQMEPDFMVIPIIGPSFIKSILRKEMAASLSRIECIAKIQEELDWDVDLQITSIDGNTGCQP